jgi:hypothetical protein
MGILFPRVISNNIVKILENFGKKLYEKIGGKNHAHNR